MKPHVLERVYLPVELKQNQGDALTKSIKHVIITSYPFSKIHFANEFAFCVVFVLNVVCRTNAILAKCSVSHVRQAFGDASLRSTTIQPAGVQIGCGSNQLHANTVWSPSVAIAP